MKNKQYNAPILKLLTIFALVFFLLENPVYAATNPNLGQAASFGILSSTYTNTVSGTTITGDLGYTTPPGVAPTVSGTTHVADGTYSTAGTDQGSALTNLNGQACTFTFTAGAIDLSTDTTHGTAGIYGPGVYCTGAASAASIGSGGITLSGSGTYIFKINGAFTTVSSSVVTLSNGASSCDVFWAPTSATTLGANSTLMGTDIDASGITIGSTVTWKGRALAFGGTVSTTTDTIDTTCSVAPTPTPTATPTQTSTTTTSSDNSTSTTTSSGGAPNPVCPTIDTGVVPPIITESRRVSATSIFINWGPFSGTDKFNVKFGPTNGNWLYNTDVTGFSTTINSLPSNQPIWVEIAARNDCQIGNYGGAKLVGGVASTNSGAPGLPNTGNPGLPNTGFDPNGEDKPWYLPVAIFVIVSGLLVFFRNKH